MDLTREVLLQRRADIVARIAEETRKRDELNLLIPTLDGARQDCDHWLGVLDAEEKLAAEPKQLRAMPAKM